MDTGATRCLLNKRVFDILEKKVILNRSEKSTTLLAVNNQKIDTSGTYGLQIAIEKKEAIQDFIIAADIAEDCIIGSDAIKSLSLVIDGEKGSVHMKENEEKICVVNSIFSASNGNKDSNGRCPDR